MAEASTYNDILRFIGDVKPPAAPTPEEQEARQRQAVASQGFQPQPATARFGQQGDQARLNQTREQKFVAENRDAGVPLDTESGMGAGTRAKMSFERVPAKQVEWLSKQPGIESARLGKDGTSVIARVKAEDGTPRDILLDERRTTMKDFADITGDLPQVVASTLAAYFTGGMNLAPQAAAVAGVTALTGGVQDAATRGASGRDVDAGEIAGARAMGAAFDTALPLVPAGSKRLLQSAVGPFAKGVGPLETAAKEAGKRLGVPLSASQVTGNKALARMETFTENLPFGTPLVEQRKAQEAAVNRVREFLLEGPEADVPGSQEIAERVGGTLELEKGAAERNIASKRMAGESRSQQDVKTLLEQNLPGGDVSPSQAGAAIRSRVIGMRDTFKREADANYAKVYALAEKPVVSGLPNGATAEYLGKKGAVLADKGPQVDQWQVKLPGEPRGLTMTRDEMLKNGYGVGAPDEASTAFVPSEPIKELVNEIQSKTTEATRQLLPEIKRIFKVGDTIPDKMTLRQAVELRSVIGDMMSRPEALAGIPTGYMKRLYGAASEAIEQGVEAAPNKEIGAALAEAQKHYRENAWKFEQPGVADLFDESAPGKGFRVGDSDVARRLTAGGGDVDQLKVMASMLGKDSAEYKGVLRASLNEMMQDASFGQSTMDAGQFLGRLKGMSPEFRKEAIGPIEKELVGDAKVLGLLQGRKIDPLDMERILNSRPGKVAETVREVATEQAELDKIYGSNLMRQLTDGRFDPTRLNADEFVNRFVNTASAAELKQAMTMLRASDPEIPNLIRRRATADLLTEAAGDIKPESVVAGEIGNFDFQKLLSKLSGASGEKYKTLLGAEVMGTLKDLMTIEAARSKSASMGKQSGQLVYSNILAAIMDFKFSEVPRIAKNRVLAGLLTTPGLKTWLTSHASIPATPKTRMAVMASPPVIRAILSEFSEEPDLAGQVIDAIKTSPDTQEPQPRTARDLIDQP